MRTLSRRGLMTGAAGCALEPLLPQLRPVVAGFTVADVRSAAEALRAAQVPTLSGGSYDLIAHPDALSAMFGPDWEAQRLTFITDGEPLTVNVFRGDSSWSDQTESALASHEGR